MADLNYISPAGIAPDFGKTDMPGLAGYFAADKQRDYENLMSLQKLFALDNLQKQANAQEEYVLGAPVRASGRLKDIATNRAEADTVARRKTAEVVDKELGNIFTQSTQPGKIAATNEDNDTKVLQDKVKRNQMAMSHLMSLEPYLANNSPAAYADFMQRARDLGMKENDPIYQHFLQAESTDDLKGRLGKIREHMTYTDQKYRQKLDEIMQPTMAKIGSQERIHNQQDATRRYIAELNASLKEQGMQLKLKPEDVPKTDAAYLTHMENRLEALKREMVTRTNNKEEMGFDHPLMQEAADIEERINARKRLILGKALGSKAIDARTAAQVTGQAGVGNIPGQVTEEIIKGPQGGGAKEDPLGLRK